MLNNIVDEALNKLSKEKLNIFNLMDRYAGIKDDDGIERSYEIMQLDFVNEFYNNLLLNVETLNYSSIYKYKPEYVSYDIYGTSSYDYLVLYANKITNKKDFIRENLENGKIKYFNPEILSIIENYITSKRNNSGKNIKVENYILYNI